MTQNKMGSKPIHRLMWQMGLPMIVSMVLQSVYNIVDTAFVINMGEDGIAGNLALTYAFPIQLLIIAVGVGTGIGINALLSKSLGEGIYRVGLTAAIMQGLLSVMMFGVSLILGTAEQADLLQGAFGVYYKIMQFALFAAFGISNTIITVLSFNYGLKDKARMKDCIKYGLMISITVSLAITALFEAFASPLSRLFGLSSGESGEELIRTVTLAVRIGSAGYVFMGISVAVQGIFQAFRFAVKPLVISLLRLAILVFSIVYAFTLSPRPDSLIWWAFPITELVTAAISLAMLRATYKKVVAPLPDKQQMPDKQS